MSEQDFEKLIDRNKYQVFIFTCPCSFPIFFAKHVWFVINKKGVISRYEVLMRAFRNDIEANGNHFFVNFFQSTNGLEMFPFWTKFYWRSKLFKTIEGDENSTARKMVDFIENSKKTYPYHEKYSLMGPNSNTYIQWVLNQFPELKIKLPWNCVGKNYKE